ncbi:MAG: hypothetical protein IT450_22170 [Phycisphaerales bacterium]|nr:hypothetical protein [Phycisphaerales bacterium]
MSEYPELDQRSELNRTRVVEMLLWVVGVLAILATAGWTIGEVWRISNANVVEGESAATPLLRTFALAAAGLVAGLGLIALAELLRRVESVILAGGPISGAAPQPPARTADIFPSHTLDELVVLLREVRDISLLNDQQRQKRLEIQGQAVVGVLRREVPQLLREHNWIEARHRVQEARERFPNFPDWDSLEQQIEQLRAQVEQHDIESAERQIADLSALGAWDRVADVVKELMQRHPDSTRAYEVAQRVRSSRQKIETEQRAKMMAQAQESTNQREWNSAYLLAQQITARWPKSLEAQALRMQLPTLRENAEIQTRQKMESEIRNLVRAQRFSDAARIAHEVITQYPHSPQAEALREQLPKLQEKAELAMR